MNQLNKLQEKLQSNVISTQEQKALKGKRGRIFKTGYANNDPNDTSSYPTTTVRTTSTGSTTTISSPTTTTSSGQTAIGKFGLREI